jgi:hypothetical protein
MSDKNIFYQYKYCTGHSIEDRTWQHKAQKRVCFEFHEQIIKDNHLMLIGAYQFKFYKGTASRNT